MKSIRDLIVRMATENSGWGYLRIQGEMKKLGHTHRATIAKTLKSNGIAPTPTGRQVGVRSSSHAQTSSPPLISSGHRAFKQRLGPPEPHSATIAPRHHPVNRPVAQPATRAFRPETHPIDTPLPHSDPAATT